MTDTTQRLDPAVEPAQETPRAAGQPRKPYKAPQLSKKRSLARATLFTAMGPTMAGITMMG